MAEKRPLLLDLHIPYGITPIRYLGGMQAHGSNEEKDAYLEALMRELTAFETELEDYEIRAVRLSGGAATVMKPDLLGQLLAAVRRHLPLAEQAEVSFDALPNTIGTPALTGIAFGNPNRAELMMRSYREEDLRALACPFRLQDVRNALLFFGRFRLNNLGLTVNYGIPGQTLQDWEFTVHSCLNAAPAHITLAPLDVTGEAGMPDEDERFAMFTRGRELLEAEGYLHYGLGLFCRAGCEYRFEALAHNGCEVLGLGANAVSRMDGFITRNTNNLGIYIRHAGDFEKVTAQAAALTPEDTLRSYAAGRLGMVQGLVRTQAEARFGAGWEATVTPALEALCERAWVTETDGGWVPTLSGLFHNRELCSLLSGEKE